MTALCFFPFDDGKDQTLMQITKTAKGLVSEALEKSIVCTSVARARLMKIFETIYSSVIRFSKLESAPWYLALLSFLESFIFTLSSTRRHARSNVSCTPA